MPKFNITRTVLALELTPKARQVLERARRNSATDLLRRIDAPISALIVAIFSDATNVTAKRSQLVSVRKKPQTSVKWTETEDSILRAHMRVFSVTPESIKSVRAFLPGRTSRAVETHFRRMSA